MELASEAVESLAPTEARADAEIAALVEAGLAVLRNGGAEHLTVGSVLAEAGLSTRAFYRHFPTKDALVLAIYERESASSLSRLRARVAAVVDPRAALEAWIDETLALGFAPHRARRTRTLAVEGARLQHEFPAEFAAIERGVLAPLVDLLVRGRADGTFPRADPDLDARSIHAVAWVVLRQRLAGAAVTREQARAHLLRFCLAALGATR